jgi:formylmethanofuran dehydrogenase subunit C
MSGLVFKLKAAPDERVDLSKLTPSILGNMSSSDIARLVIGTSQRKLTIGDLFTITGKAADSVTIAGGSNRLDFVGAELEHGTIVVDGDVGAFAGRDMSGGRLEIKGDAGAWLASGLSGGLIWVKGAAGSFIGGQRAGDKFGMSGGIVVVDGHAGDRAGERMRRGTLVVRGRCGAYAGSRMIGGTIWAEQGFGPSPGVMLRRGTLIGPSVERLLATFVDTGKQDLVILRILSRYLTASLGQLAPRPLSGTVRKYAGDLATVGKGEILITA